MVYAKFSKILVRTGIPDVCLFLFTLRLLLCLLIFRQNVSLQLIRFLGEGVSKARLLTLHHAAPHSCFSLGTVPVAGPSHLVRAASSLTTGGKGLPGVPPLTAFGTTQADESPDVQKRQPQLDRGHVCLPAAGQRTCLSSSMRRTEPFPRPRFRGSGGHCRTQASSAAPSCFSCQYFPGLGEGVPAQAIRSKMEDICKNANVIGLGSLQWVLDL